MTLETLPVSFGVLRGAPAGTAQTRPPGVGFSVLSLSHTHTLSLSLPPLSHTHTLSLSLSAPLSLSLSLSGVGRRGVTGSASWNSADSSTWAFISHNLLLEWS